MTTDRLFVILLVMLIPMTGCFGAIENSDAEENESVSDNMNDQNSPPVIYGFSVSLGKTCPDLQSSCSSDDTVYPVIYGNLMALDFDGTVVEFGIDIDLDGDIDFDMGGNYSEYEYKANYEANVSDFNPSLLGEDYGDGDSNCYQWVNLMAVDDDGDVTIQPNRWTFNWRTDLQECVTNPYDYE